MSQTAACCPQGAHEFLEEDPKYVPQGEMINFDSLDAYLVGKGSLCLVFIDIFGLPSGMNKLICDTLAARISNLTVIAPDFFPGKKLFGDDPLTQRGSALMSSHMMGFIWRIISCQLMPYLTKFNWENSAETIFSKVIAHMKTTYHCEKFVLLGVCWGSYIAFRACGEAKEKDDIIGNITLHASVENIATRFKEDTMAIVNAVNCFQFIASTKGEPPSWKPDGSVQKLLSEKTFGALNEVYVYPNEEHGFFTRGDTTNENTRLAIGDVIFNLTRWVEKIQVNKKE